MDETYLETNIRRVAKALERMADNEAIYLKAMLRERNVQWSNLTTQELAANNDAQYLLASTLVENFRTSERGII